MATLHPLRRSSAARLPRRHGKQSRFRDSRFERLEGRYLLAAEPFAGLDSSAAIDVHHVYAPGTPLEIVEAHEHALHLHGEEGPSAFTFGDGYRWDRTAYDGFNSTQGNPTRLTWSIVPDGTSTINDTNGGASGKTSNLIARLDAIYGSAGQSVLESKVWFPLFESVFDRWSEVSGIDFLYEPNDDGAAQSYTNRGQVGVRGDIRIGGHNIDGNSGILAYNYYPDLGEMVIDTADGFYTSTGGNSLRLRNTVAHEVGHGIGIGHVEPVDGTKLLEPFLTTAFDGPQFDDILAAHRGYGDDLEQDGGNDSAATATPLGSLTLGQSVVLGSDAVDVRVSPGETDFVSIDDDSDIDFFRFQVAAPGAASVTLWPLGPSYLSGIQDGTPSLFDASAQSDLSLAVLDSDGVTVLATANATGLGEAEVLTNVVLPQAGDYFVRVRGAQNAAQFYQLELLLDDLSSITTRIVDNGDAAFRTEGNWVAWGGQGYQGDVHEAMPGTGTQVATWTFVGLEPGEYDVAATWSSYSNRATNAPFEIYDGSNRLAVQRVNQQVNPVGFSDSGATWQPLGGPYTLTGTTLVVRLSDDADGRLNADAIRIEKIGESATTPEIQVLDGAVDLVDGAASVSLGSTILGSPVTRTFAVRNVGGQDLTLSEPIRVPAGFAVASTFGATTLAPGESTSFVVRLTAATAGLFQGNVSFDNNDDDENPFDFTVAGTVDALPPPPVVQYQDNGDAGFATVGAWTNWGGQGYRGDVHEALPGTGAQTASWTFTALQPGLYEVAATWTTYSNRATNSPFEIYDGATLLTTERVNQRIAPVGFSDDGVTWQVLGEPLAVTGSTLIVRMTDDADGRLNADGVRIERVGTPVDAPEIQVLDGTTDIADGSGTVSFGNTTPGSPLNRTFTVKNVGTQPLTLSEPISVPTGFTLASSFASTTLAAGASTTFEVRLTAAGEGNFSGVVSFGNDDADENLFDFTVQGTVADVPPPPVIQILDNGDTGFGTVEGWTAWGGQGYQGDIHEAMPGTGSAIASWTFTDVQPGRYVVAATWSTYSNRATNSPFSIYDGATLLATERVNQRLAPRGISDAGASWQQLGATYSVTGSTLVVRLSNDADGRLNADAIRIERVGDLVNAPEIQVLAGARDITDGSGPLSFGTTPPGTPVTRTFTVKNVGTQPLTLSDTIQAPGGFMVTSSFGTTTLAAGASTTFAVALTAAVEGTYTGDVSFGNNDADENPFNFVVQGVVAAAPPDPVLAIVDNGDAAFSTAGNWSRWTGQGYQGDIHEALPGSATTVATWTFRDLPTGTYAVAATWSTYSNRATDAPFTIRDGATSRGTVRVNQRLAPNDFSSDGGAWERLGSYSIGTGTLVVALSADANGRLNADAVRIERVFNTVRFAGALASAPRDELIRYVEPVGGTVATAFRLPAVPRVVNGGGRDRAEFDRAPIDVLLYGRTTWARLTRTGVEPRGFDEVIARLANDATERADVANVDYLIERIGEWLDVNF